MFPYMKILNVRKSRHAFEMFTHEKKSNTEPKLKHADTNFSNN